MYLMRSHAGTFRGTQGVTNMAAQFSNALTIIRRKQVEARTGLSRSTIYQRIKEGTFPTAVSLGERAVGWIESEINTWLTTQVEKSRKA
jgi:prophage regulatory protein